MAAQAAREADVADLFGNPLHPYTEGLMFSIPSESPLGNLSFRISPRSDHTRFVLDAFDMGPGGASGGLRCRDPGEGGTGGWWRSWPTGPGGSGGWYVASYNGNAICAKRPGMERPALPFLSATLADRVMPPTRPPHRQPLLTMAGARSCSSTRTEQAGRRRQKEEGKEKEGQKEGTVSVEMNLTCI